MAWALAIAVTTGVLALSTLIDGPAPTLSTPTAHEQPPIPSTPVEPDPAERLAQALRARQWAVVETLIDHMPADAPDLAGLRDYMKRGQRRDRDHVLESTLSYRVAAWQGTTNFTLGSVRPERALTIRNDQTQYPLVALWPRRNETRDWKTFFHDWRVLAIHGLEIPTESDPKSEDLRELHGQPVRLLSGTALERLEPDVLASLSELEELDLRMVQAKDRLLPLVQAITGLKQLRVLRLPNNSVLSDADMLGISALPKLEVLHLGGGSGGDRGLAGIGSARHLRELVVVNRTLSDADVLGLAACSDLRRLEIHRPLLNAARGLESLVALDSLQILRLSLTQADMLNAVGGMARLETMTLSLTVDPAQGDGIRSLHALGELATLKELTLICSRSSSPLSESECAGLSAMKSLRRLHLVGSAFGDAALAEAMRLPSLEMLRMQDPVVTDTGVIAVAATMPVYDLQLQRAKALTGTCLPALCAQPGLRNLTLSATGMTEAALLALASPGALERLDIRDTPVFTDAAVAHIATWTRRPRITLDEKMISADARKRLLQLSESAIPGVGFTSAEANEF